VAPYSGISLEDKRRTTDLLLRAGADITETNAVRKHLSRVKGGRLARIAYPARVESLIISDVIGDGLDVIASGPTAPDTTTYSEALHVIHDYGIYRDVPECVLDLLRRGEKGLIPETPKENDGVFKNVTNTIIGSNEKAIAAARIKALELGFDVIVLSAALRGEAQEIGRRLAKEALAAAKELRRGSATEKCLCLLSGGETTVTVQGQGLGGRNMELALAFALEVDGERGITLLSAGTDGTDGPTDAAGAIVDGKSADRGRAIGANPSQFLANNDSYSFFKKTGDLLLTGPTGTNVMDLQILFIRP
jgi:glycerate 2-kinase